MSLKHVIEEFANELRRKSASAFIGGNRCTPLLYGKRPDRHRIMQQAGADGTVQVIEDVQSHSRTGRQTVQAVRGDSN